MEIERLQGKAFATFGLVTLSLMSCSTKAPEPQRPNIVFIMSDDHAYQAIGAYSNKLIQNPKHRQIGP